MVNGAGGAPVKVLSVVGAGRSGTTVLASILTEVDGFVSAGELRWLWQRGVIEERPCGCGAAPGSCPVWSPVIAETLGTTDRDQGLAVAREIVVQQREIASSRNRIRVLRSVNGGGAEWPALRRVREVTATACQSLAEVTDSGVVIDTSKRPFDAAVIAAAEGFEHYVLHIIRDPRAVVHSWRRAKSFSVGGQTRTMGTRRLPSTVRRWTASCLGAELLRRQLPGSHWLRMRYEDFSADPRHSVEMILKLLDEDGPAPFETDDTVLLHPNHIVAGNPSRFTTGSVTIRPDEEWRERMPKRHQRLVALSTAPLLRRYGYALGD